MMQGWFIFSAYDYEGVEVGYKGDFGYFSHSYLYTPFLPVYTGVPEFCVSTLHQFSFWSFIIRACGLMQ